MKRKSELRENVIMYNSIFSSVNLPCMTNCVRARKRIPLTYFKITFQKSVEGHVAHWKKKLINDMVITSSLVTTKTDFCNPPYSIGKKNTPVEPASWLKMLESRKDLSQQTCDQRFQPSVTQTYFRLSLVGSAQRHKWQPEIRLRLQVKYENCRNSPQLYTLSLQVFFCLLFQKKFLGSSTLLKRTELVGIVLVVKAITYSVQQQRRF